MTADESSARGPTRSSSDRTQPTEIDTAKIRRQYVGMSEIEDLADALDEAREILGVHRQSSRSDLERIVRLVDRTEKAEAEAAAAWTECNGRILALGDALESAENSACWWKDRALLAEARIARAQEFDLGCHCSNIGIKRCVPCRVRSALAGSQ